MAIDVKVPSPGESINEVTVSKWLKQKGDYILIDEPIVELESEKATFEVNAEKSGILLEIFANEGNEIKVGEKIFSIDEKAAAPENLISKKEDSKPKVEPIKVKEQVVIENKIEEKSSINSEILIAPLANELILKFNINPNKIIGTGANGKITKNDVMEYIVNSGNLSNISQKDNISDRNIRSEKMSNLRKTVSKRLVAAKNETAMLTTFNEINMKPIMDLRAKYKTQFLEKHEIGLGFMSFFTKACCMALKEWPAVNAYISGESIEFHDYCDISIAVSGPKGLVVPVIRNAENLSLAGIEKEVKNLATKAKDNKLTIEDMSGGTFTITNGGVFGSMMSTPIINPPQSAILGMHNIVERPFVENGQIVIRPIMFVALSYDHRIIDGRESVGFLVRVKTLLENPQMMIDGKLPEINLLNL